MPLVKLRALKADLDTMADRLRCLCVFGISNLSLTEWDPCNRQNHLLLRLQVVAPHPSTHSVLPSTLGCVLYTVCSCQRFEEIYLTRIDSDISFFPEDWDQLQGNKEFRIKRHLLLKPVAMEFAHSGLEERHRVHIFVEVHIHAKEYHYQLCPLKHPYRCQAEHSCVIWYNTSTLWIPRIGNEFGLIDSLKSSTNPQSLARLLPMAWGIHIIEGSDYVWKVWTIICVLVVCSGPVIAYVIF